jgi:hypothetical protein
MATRGRRFIGNAFDRRSDLVNIKEQERICEDLERRGVRIDALFNILQRQAVLPRILEAVEGCMYWAVVAPFYDQCVIAQRKMIERFRRAGFDPAAVVAVQSTTDFLEELSVPARRYGWIMRGSEARRLMREFTQGRVTLPRPTPRGVERFRRALVERHLTSLEVLIHRRIAIDLARPVDRETKGRPATVRKKALTSAAFPAARLTAKFLRAYLPDLASRKKSEHVRKAVARVRLRPKTRKLMAHRSRLG